MWIATMRAYNSATAKKTCSVVFSKKQTDRHTVTDTVNVTVAVADAATVTGTVTKKEITTRG